MGTIYTFHLITDGGKVCEQVEFYCMDDFAALDRAAAVSGGSEVEIWRGQTLLTRLKPDGEAALAQTNRTQKPGPDLFG